MFPEPKYSPSRIPESIVRFFVPSFVLSELPRPVLGIGSGSGLSVILASVPEAAVYEHRYPLTREHDVGGSTAARLRPRRDPVPQPRGV